MSFGGLCLLALAAQAEAAEPRHRFNIPAKSYADALIDLAVQANVSLVGAQACGTGGYVTVTGSYTVDQALAKLLTGAPCSWRVVDSRTVRIQPVQADSQPRAAPPSAPVTLVTELMVTARRRPERVDALPAGVSVISSEQLRAFGARDTRDTAGQLVGVTMTNLGPGRDKLLMRGLSDGAFTGRARSTVGTYLDDVPINSNAPNPDLRLVDVERVETVRGPQGALYGSGALSGVYRIVTNKPDFNDFTAAAAVSAAHTHGGSPSYEAEAATNLPILDGRGAIRAVAYYDLLGGYLDNVDLRLSDVDKTTRGGGRLAAGFQLADSWRIDVSGAYQRLNSQDSQYTTVGAGRNLRTNTVRENHDNNFGEGAVSLHGDLPWADFTSTTALVRHDFDSQYDANALTGTAAFANAFQLTAADQVVYRELARIGRIVQDVTLSSHGDGPWRWLVGAYGSGSVERTPSFLIVTSPPLVAGGPTRAARAYSEERRDTIQDFAVYGEASWTFAPRWTVSAGARAFQNRLKTRSTIDVEGLLGSRVVANGRSFGGVSPKLSLQYETAAGGLIYGLYSEGYRAGGVNSGGFLPVSRLRSTFAPDQLRNFELGAKGRFMQGRLAARTAIFFDLWDNIQSDQYRPNGLAYTANVGDAQIGGLETELAYDLASGLSVQANAMLAEPRFTRTNPDFTAPSTTQLGVGLPGAPRSAGGLLVRYEHPLSNALILRLVGQASYIGSSRLTFVETDAAKTGSYVEARLSADIAADHWTAGLFVSNPTDASGDTFAYGNPFTFGPPTASDAARVRQVTPQRPRTLGVRLSADF